MHFVTIPWNKKFKNKHFRGRWEDLGRNGNAVAPGCRDEPSFTVRGSPSGNRIDRSRIAYANKSRLVVISVLKIFDRGRRVRRPSLNWE